MTTNSDAPSILFISQHYWPDFASTTQHLTDLAEYLVCEGFQVHVLCSRGHCLSGSLAVPTSEVDNGVHICRVPATQTPDVINNYGYRNAAFVIDLGPYMKERIRSRGVDGSRLETLRRRKPPRTVGAERKNRLSRRF